MSVRAILEPAAAAAVLTFLWDREKLQAHLLKMPPDVRSSFADGVRELEDAAAFYRASLGVSHVRAVDVVSEYVSTGVAAEMLGCTSRTVINKLEGDYLRGRRLEGSRRWEVERQSVLDLLAESTS